MSFCFGTDKVSWSCSVGARRLAGRPIGPNIHVAYSSMHVRTLKLPLLSDRSYTLTGILHRSRLQISDRPGAMEDTRGRWERAYLEAVDFDTWGQVTAMGMRFDSLACGWVWGLAATETHSKLFKLCRLRKHWRGTSACRSQHQQ